MKYYIIAGEKSGDIHASNLVKGIIKHDEHAVIRGWGGDAMKNAGVEMVKHIHDLAFMGLVEVLFHLNTIRRNFKFAYSDIRSFNPDVLILVDFPGFNLRLAKYAFKHHIKVFFYISPTIWAWQTSRVYQIKKYVNKMFVILPFEKEFYKKYDVDVIYEGNPILDSIGEALENTETLESFCQQNSLPPKPIVAILPGSRVQEIKKILPVICNTVSSFHDYSFVIAGLSFLPASLYEEFIHQKNVYIVYDKTYSLLHQATAAIVTSGTATLETALFHVPQVVCYKTNPLSYAIAKKLVKVKYVSLVNLILNKESVRELIQRELNVKNLTIELQRILDDSHRKIILDDEHRLSSLIGEKGSSERIAKRMIELLKNS